MNAEESAKHVATICIPEFIALWRDAVARGMEVSRLEESMIRHFVIYLEHAVSLIDVGGEEFYRSAAARAADDICSKHAMRLPEQGREEFKANLASEIKDSLAAMAAGACCRIEHELRKEAIREFHWRIADVGPSPN